MANMSYCRFQNTFLDLRDCLRALQEEGIEGIESADERAAAADLVKLAQTFINEYNESETDLSNSCYA